MKKTEEVAVPSEMGRCRTHKPMWNINPELKKIKIKQNCGSEFGLPAGVRPVVMFFILNGKLKLLLSVDYDLFGNLVLNFRKVPMNGSVLLILRNLMIHILTIYRNDPGFSWIHWIG
jgi:hypothetical protein